MSKVTRREWEGKELEAVSVPGRGDSCGRRGGFWPRGTQDRAAVGGGLA